MKNVVPRFYALTIFLIVSVSAIAQVSAEEYRRAEMYHPQNIQKLVFKLRVDPHWIGESSHFWYKNDLPEGKEFIRVDPEKRIKERAFDHERLAKALSEATGKPIPPDNLPFNTIEFDKDETSITFRVEGDEWKCDLKTYSCVKREEPELKILESPSPDGSWIAFVKGYDLYVRSAETGEEIRLTFDGYKDYYYAVPVPSARMMVQQVKIAVEQRVIAYWSPDSRRLFTYRIDARDAGKLYLIQAIPPTGVRPKFYSFAYPLPGEINVPKAESIIFDLSTGDRIDVQAMPRPILYYGEPWPYPRWINDRHIAVVNFARGWRTVRLSEIDSENGNCRTVLEEQAETMIDPNIHDIYFFKKGRDFLWTSERDGWHHIYRYDIASGDLKNRVTMGDWVVHSIAAVDEAKKQVFFIAGGRESGRDPYLRHLYRVNLDGTGLTLLTPEDADHAVIISPDFNYFVDTFSKVNTIPKSALRSCSDGRILITLEEADISRLTDTGWRRPEPFKVKARDSRTDIYGVLYRPSHFDETRKYPVIDNIYTGPHYVMAPKSFSASLSRQTHSIAELGFIVINIDGLGTARRSKEFHDHSYKNLADGGIPDHISGMRQLADRYPYMDLERVGIFGFSAGGYDSAHAIFAYPDFYKVAVAASGNYDHRMDKAWWNELWMDFPVREHYIEQSCLTIAHNLKGKLFLAHGELDENVNPYNTIRLVNSLIKANKDFEMLIVPNEDHYLDDNPYFVRRRWDFFVRHLLGVEPPAGYQVGEFRSR